MKHTITINQENTTEHIIHLDQHLPLTIEPLPPNIAYQIQETPIITTTTQTLTNLTIQQIRQKEKTITTPTHLIIIENTNNQAKLQTETIKENPMITIHHTKPNTITKTLNRLLETLTPPTNKAITTKKHTLYHNNTPIKTYKNREYLQLITKILNTNPTLTLQQAEYQAQRQYYQYITYDKHNHNYKITIKQKTQSTHKKLTNAIQEKNLQTQKTEHDEETLCQNNNTTLEPLPPTPWNNTLHNTTTEHQKYKTRQNTRHNNPDTIQQIHHNKTQKTTILNTTKPDRNINTTKKQYTITRIKNKKQQQYYKTHDKYQARYIRDKLEQHQYDTTQITKYETEYQYQKKQYKNTYKKQYQTIDYYTNTTTKLKQTLNTKEEYQRQQIQQKTTRHQ